MVVNHKLPLESLLYSAAPMVGQSDLPFRLQTVRNGATSTWTQMYFASDLNSDRDMFDTLCKSLVLGRDATENTIRGSTHPMTGQSAPQIVQLAGNDVQQLVEAARKVAPFADAIDLNLGCPQRHAEQGHYGAYLLPKQNWPLIAKMVSGLVQAVDIPITTKIRLTVPKEQTPQLAVILAHAGSSLVTVHPRFAPAVRRRKGLADLDQVVQVRQALQSEGLLRNVDHSGGGEQRSSAMATGVMVGETLLENPALFRPSLSEADRIGGSNELSAMDKAREYLALRDLYEEFESPLKVAKQHIQSIICAIPHIPSADPSVTAERHRSAAFWSQTIKSIQSTSDFARFCQQHLESP
ncbi:related to tRNA dihydrouridine synthase [Ustilago sp. UG-2017b]|nr:related to tRNA dihydrouridine synthase [Ustilago sp. UG-2017b]